MNDQSHDHQRHAEMLGAHVLGALTATERAAVDDHLAGCEHCRRDIVDLRLAADAIPGTVPPVDPPPDLKARIMRTVSAEAELLQATGPEADRAPRQRGRLSLRPRVRIASAVAAAVAVAGAAAIVVTGIGPSGESRVVAAAITDPALAKQARASIRLTGHRASLRVHGLPEPPADRVYEVWVKPPAAAPQPSGTTFVVRSGSIEIRRSVRRGDQVMVTVEPTGGSPAPTRAPLIVGQPA